MSRAKKSTKITFWISTIIIALLMMSSILMIKNPETLALIKHLEVPLWLHYEITIGKFIGGLILLLPFFPKRLKEWTYVAMGIDVISAFICIAAIDGMVPELAVPLIAFIILLVSYITFHKIKADEKY